MQEIDKEVNQSDGLMKKPEKRFTEWQRDFDAWEKRFSKRMTKIEKELNKQMKKMENFFE